MGEESLTIKKLRERFPDEILEVTLRPNDDAVTLKRDRLVEIALLLRDDPELDYRMPLDVCGVDYSALGRTPRFAVVYHLYSVEKDHRIRLKVLLDESDLAVDSLTGVWKGVNWFEREAFDLFGINFRNHPFLRRILCHDQFVGHALRKDYDAGKRQLCTQLSDLEFE